MEKIKSLFSNHKKLTLGVVVLLALSLPFAVNLVMQRQDLQQGAQVAVPPISVKFSNPTTIGVNQSTTAYLAMTTSTNDVGSIKLSIKYDPTMVTLTEGTYPTGLQAFDKKNENGSFDLTLLNPTSTAVTGQDLQFVTFTVTGLKTGTATLRVESIQATATGFPNFLTVDPASASVTYTIGNSVSPTVTSVPPPNTTITVTPTNTPTPTPTAVPASPTATPTPIPTATSAPTATPIPGDTLLRIATYLPGIGSGAANLGLNSTPIHPQREGTLTILNTNSEVIKTVTGPIQYSSESGVYSGTFALGTTFPTGIYNIKLRMNNTLVKLYPSAMNIASGQNNSQTGTNPTLIPGDLNSDNSLGVFDWTYMIACIKNEAACTSAIRLLADLNDNGSVDEKDVQILQRGFALRDGD